MITRSTLLGVALLCAVAAVPAAEERPVELAPGPGRDLVEANCAACHSPDYIRMNAPFLDRQGWTAEVAKMVNVFRAPVDQADVPRIVDYLAEHYGPAAR